MRVLSVLWCTIFSMNVFGDSGYIEPVTDRIAKEECNACHFAFPAMMLPQASWKKILGNLENHFGEDASLDSRTRQHIGQYLVSRSGDAGSTPSKFIRGLDNGNPPIRITETEYWIEKHLHISEEKLQSGLAGLKASCAVCHLRAVNGIYKYE